MKPYSDPSNNGSFSADGLNKGLHGKTRVLKLDVQLALPQSCPFDLDPPLSNLTVIVGSKVPPKLLYQPSKGIELSPLVREALLPALFGLQTV